MITVCTGKIRTVHAGMLEIELGLAGGGITCAVMVNNGQSYQVESTVTLHIYWHWTQESGPQLYGFRSLFERELFELLLGCSGLGPRKALSLFSQMQPEELVQLLAVGDIDGLCKANGIGPKMAKLMVLELKDKVGTLEKLLSPDDLVGVSFLSKLTGTLQALNYSKGEVAHAVAYVRECFRSASFDEQLRAAFAYLQGKKVRTSARDNVNS